MNVPYNPPAEFSKEGFSKMSKDPKYDRAQKYDVSKKQYGGPTGNWMYEMGGATNVTHDFPIRNLHYGYGGRLRYDEYSTVGGPNLSGGSFSASASGAAPMSSTTSGQGWGSNGSYSASLGQLGGMSTVDYGNSANWGNAAQDMAGMAPILYNLGRGIFEKPYKMNAADYATAPTKFEATKFDKTPFEQGRAQQMYAMREKNFQDRAGMLASHANLTQGQAEARNKWQNAEAMRKQGVNQFNTEIDARNKQMAMQVDIMNQQAKAARNEMFGKAMEQTAQTFNVNPQYYRAMAGQAPRQPFTGWQGAPTMNVTSSPGIKRRGGKLYR